MGFVIEYIETHLSQLLDLVATLADDASRLTLVHKHAQIDIIFVAVLQTALQ